MLVGEVIHHKWEEYHLQQSHVGRNDMWLLIEWPVYIYGQQPKFND